MSSMKREAVIPLSFVSHTYYGDPLLLLKQIPLARSDTLCSSYSLLFDFSDDFSSASPEIKLWSGDLPVHTGQNDFAYGLRA